MRGFICGAFDLLHAGHILAFKEAKKHCDFLLVGLHVDPSIERKGKKKPVQGILERAIQLTGCEDVDQIVVYETEEDISIILRNFDIDVRFLDEEYELNLEQISDIEAVDIEFIPREHPYSTTRLRKKK